VRSAWTVLHNKGWVSGNKKFYAVVQTGWDSGGNDSGSCEEGDGVYLQVEQNKIGGQRKHSE